MAARPSLRLAHVAQKRASTILIFASLAIGIGANSAIFSVVDALLLRPLPYPQPERLAAIWLHLPAIGILRDWPSPGQYIDMQNENHSFEEMALAQSRSFTLTGREQPERIDGMRGQSSLLACSALNRCLAACSCPKRTSPANRCGRYSQRARLEAPVQFRSIHCRQEHHAQRKSIHCGRRAAARLHAQRGSDAVGRTHGQGGRIPPTALGRRCRETPRRRKL